MSTFEPAVPALRTMAAPSAVSMPGRADDHTIGQPAVASAPARPLRSVPHPTESPM